MAGGGVGEAMLIGAAVGAGTGGIMSAAQDKDPLEGALLGAAMGAAGGGLGSGIGGALSSTAESQIGSQVAQQGLQEGASQVGQQAVSNMAQQGANQATLAMNAMPNLAANQAANTALAEGSTQLAGQGAQQLGQSTAQAWGQQGIGQGVAPALTNAQAYGAGAGGGIMGLIGNAQNQGEQWAPEAETYSGPLSQFKYDPNKFRPSVAPGYADGGVASLGPQVGMYPQSQLPDRTQFATPSQMPISREVVGADYDSRISPYTGDMMMARGGISSLGSYSDGGRMLRGPGDGMSDDIPGVIAGKQPARLADGEFVVPADVVSHLGNGSTDAGAKKLYSMMDNVRKARTGSKKQGKQIKADKYMPGMKRGGIAYYEEGGEAKPAGLATNFQPSGYEGQYYNPQYWQQQLNAGTQSLTQAQDSLNQYIGKASDPSLYNLSNLSETAQQNPELNALYQKYLGRNIGQGEAFARDPNDVSISAEAQEWAKYNAPVAEAQSMVNAAQPNVSRLASTSVKYDPYTMASRPSASEPQFYGNIYRPEYPDYSTPGYTLAGNLGEWSNVAGEQARAAQPASVNQQVTQSYLQNLGRAPDTGGFNYWMNSGMTGPEIAGQMRSSPEGKRMAPGAVDAYYQQLLGRNAEEGGMGYWGGMMSSGDVSPATVRKYIADSPESQVLQAYQDVLGRAPDQGGAAYWNQMAASGVPVSDIRQLMRESSEGFVNQAYQQNLGRRPDEGGLNYWNQMLNSNQVSRDDLNSLISKSAESGDKNAWQRYSPKPLEVNKRKGGIASLIRR